MSDSANVVTDPRPDPATDDVTETRDEANVDYRPADELTPDERDALAAYRTQRDATPEQPTTATLGDEAVTSDSGLTNETRLSALEYKIACLPPELFKSRAPMTNPVDDPDDAPMVNGDDPRASQPGMQHLRTPGNWDDHPWKALADHLHDTQADSPA